MGDDTSGLTPEGDAPHPHGWQLPDDAASGEVSTSSGQESHHEEKARGRLPPAPALPQSVTGLASSVNVAGADVTFRLEQYDARAGRTGVVTVRLFGDAAIGFVKDGDWVEVTGKTKRGFLKAARAYNHTTQTQYSGRGNGCAIVVVCLVALLSLVTVVSIFVAIMQNR